MSGSGGPGGRPSSGVPEPRLGERTNKHDVEKKKLEEEKKNVL